MKEVILHLLLLYLYLRNASDQASPSSFGSVVSLGSSLISSAAKMVISQKWTCTACTFENEELHLQCAMCEAKKPEAKARSGSPSLSGNPPSSGPTVTSHFSNIITVVPRDMKTTREILRSSAFSGATHVYRPSASVEVVGVIANLTSRQSDGRGAVAPVMAQKVVEVWM